MYNFAFYWTDTWGFVDFVIESEELGQILDEVDTVAGVDRFPVLVEVLVDERRFLIRDL